MKRLLTALSALLVSFSAAAVDLTFYYPIAVGGPLTKVIDGFARDFEKANPGVKVNPIYAGNYDDTRIKALAALKAGQPAQRCSSAGKRAMHTFSTRSPAPALISSCPIWGGSP